MDSFAAADSAQPGGGAVCSPSSHMRKYAHPSLARMARLAAASAPHTAPTFVTRPLSSEQIPNELNDAVTRLVDAQLLTRNERRFVEPVHEILFDAWSALADVLLDDIEFHRFQAVLAATIALWQVRAHN